MSTRFRQWESELDCRGSSQHSLARRHLLQLLTVDPNAIDAKTFAVHHLEPVIDLPAKYVSVVAGQDTEWLIRQRTRK